MKTKLSKILTHWTIPFLTVFAIAYMVFVNPWVVQTAKLKSFDYQLQNETVYQDSNLVYVTLGEASIEANGQWPWPRDEIAQLILELRMAGAGVIVLPVLFSEADRFNKDQEFMEMLYQNGVVIAQTGSIQKSTTGIPRGVSMVGGNKDAANNLFTYPGMLGPLTSLADVVDGVGVISTAPEVDGVVRRVPLLINVQGDLYPNIAIETLRVMMGVDSYQMKTTPYGIHSVRVKGFPINRGIIKTDDRGRLFLRWNADIPTLNYTVDGLEGIEGKTVIIGLTAEGLGNPVATPLGEKYPHEIIGSTLSTIILGETVERPMWADLYELGGILAIGLLLVVVIAFAPYWFSGILIVSSLGGIGYGVTYLFNNKLWLIDPTMPAVMIFVVGFHAVFNRFVKEFMLKQQIKKQFEHYLAPAMVKKLQKNPDLLKLGGDTRQLTLLFCDIRGFTPISEQFKTNPQGLTELVNRFLTPMTDIIMVNEGTVDKYMGDCIMAFWNAPLDVEQQADKAVDTSISMLKGLKELNTQLTKEKMLPINIGIGLNTGDAVVGNMGSNQRFDYSCLGDAVNLAARLEGQTKGYGVKILFGQETAKALTGKHTILELDSIAVKGKKEPVAIYTVVDPDIVKLEEIAQLHHLVDLHCKLRENYVKQNWKFCEDAIDNLMGKFSGELDSYYTIITDRIKDYKINPPPKDWDGVFVATTK